MGMTGNGATISFLTSAFTARYRQLGSYQQSRAVLDDTALGDKREKTIPGSVIRSDVIECELFWDPDSQPPIGAAPETIKIQYPPKAGQANGATITGIGYLTRSTGPVLEHDNNLQGSFSLKLDIADGGIAAGA